MPSLQTASCLAAELCSRLQCTECASFWVSRSPSYPTLESLWSATTDCKLVIRAKPDGRRSRSRRAASKVAGSMLSPTILSVGCDGPAYRPGLPVSPRSSRTKSLTTGAGEDDASGPSGMLHHLEILLPGRESRSFRLYRLNLIGHMKNKVKINTVNIFY